VIAAITLFRRTRSSGSGLVYVEASSTSRSCRERDNQQALARRNGHGWFGIFCAWSWFARCELHL